MRHALVPALFVVLACSPVLADKLPKSAAPLTGEEVEKLYSGKTAVWKMSSVYFVPDHSTKGVFGKPKISSTFKGTWSVKDNEACMENKPATDPKTYTDCWKWWHNGKKLVSLWSTHYDSSKVDEKNGYYSSEDKALKEGDLVSASYAKAGGT